MLSGTKTTMTTKDVAAQEPPLPNIPLLFAQPVCDLESDMSETSPANFPSWMRQYRSVPVEQVLERFSSLSFSTEAEWVEGWAIVQTLCDRRITGSLTRADKQAMKQFCQKTSPTAHEAYLQARLWFGGRSYAQIYRQSNFDYYRAWLSCDGRVKKGHRAFDKAVEGESGFALCEKGIAIFMHIYWPHRHDPGGLIHPYGYYQSKSSYNSLPYVVKATDQGCPLGPLVEAYILNCVHYRAADFRNGGPLTRDIQESSFLFQALVEKVDGLAKRWQLPEAIFLKGYLIADYSPFYDMTEGALAEYVSPEELKEKGYRWPYQTCLMLAKGFKGVKRSGMEGSEAEWAMLLSSFMRSRNDSLQRALKYSSQDIADHVGYFVREMIASQKVYPEHRNIRGMLRRDIDEAIAKKMYLFDYPLAYESLGWEFPRGEGIGKRIVDYHKFIAWRDQQAFDALLRAHPKFIVNCMTRCDQATILGETPLPYHFRYEAYPFVKGVFWQQAERLKGENLPAHTFVLMRTEKHYGFFARSPKGMIKTGVLRKECPKTYALIASSLQSTKLSPKALFSRPIAQRKVLLCLAEELAYPITAGQFLRNAIMQASQTPALQAVLSPVCAWVVRYQQAMDEKVFMEIPKADCLLDLNQQAIGSKANVQGRGLCSLA